MLQSYEEFKSAVTAALMDKVAQRIEAEKQHISNELLRGAATESEEQSQSNETEN
jgi:Tfp pilus assembly major pilin PilA